MRPPPLPSVRIVNEDTACSLSAPVDSWRVPSKGSPPLFSMPLQRITVADPLTQIWEPYQCLAQAELISARTTIMSRTLLSNSPEQPRRSLTYPHLGQFFPRDFPAASGTFSPFRNREDPPRVASINAITCKAQARYINLARKKALLYIQKQSQADPGLPYPRTASLPLSKVPHAVYASHPHFHLTHYGH